MHFAGVFFLIKFFIFSINLFSFCLAFCLYYFLRHSVSVINKFPLTFPVRCVSLNFSKIKLNFLEYKLRTIIKIFFFHFIFFFGVTFLAVRVRWCVTSSVRMFLKFFEPIIFN